MRLSRMTTRRWMVVVAIVALPCAATVILMERRERFDRIAEHAMGAPLGASSSDSEESIPIRVLRWRWQVMVWDLKMAEKY